MILSFSRELLPLHSAEITESCARAIDPVAPGMQMLSSYLKQLFAAADRLTADQRLDAGQAAIDLLAMALRDVTPSVPGGYDSTGVLLDMMMTHVRDHLADPRLRVEELARRHHVSVRRAYTLFERIGRRPVLTCAGSGCSQRRRCCPTRGTPDGAYRTSPLPPVFSNAGRSIWRSGGSMA